MEYINPKDILVAVFDAGGKTPEEHYERNMYSGDAYKALEMLGVTAIPLVSTYADTSKIKGADGNPLFDENGRIRKELKIYNEKYRRKVTLGADVERYILDDFYKIEDGKNKLEEVLYYFTRQAMGLDPMNIPGDKDGKKAEELMNNLKKISDLVIPGNKFDIMEFLLSPDENGKRKKKGKILDDMIPDLMRMATIISILVKDEIAHDKKVSTNALGYCYGSQMMTTTLVSPDAIFPVSAIQRGISRVPHMRSFDDNEMMNHYSFVYADSSKGKIIMKEIRRTDDLKVFDKSVKDDVIAVRDRLGELLGFYVLLNSEHSFAGFIKSVQGKLKIETYSAELEKVIQGKKISFHEESEPLLESFTTENGKIGGNQYHPEVPMVKSGEKGESFIKILFGELKGEEVYIGKRFREKEMPSLMERINISDIFDRIVAKGGKVAETLAVNGEVYDTSRAYQTIRVLVKEAVDRLMPEQKLQSTGIRAGRSI